MLIEQAVISEARAGDTGAFNRIVHAYRRRVLGTVGRLIGRPEDVEDVAQEVFVRLYHSLEQLRSPEVFEPWLFRLTTNACYDYLRQMRRRTETRMADMSEQHVARADSEAGGKVFADETGKARTRDLMNSVFQGVSEQDRILLTMKEVEGLSLKELEKIYGVNESALKVRLFRARQRVLKSFRAAQESGKLGENK